MSETPQPQPFEAPDPQQAFARGGLAESHFAANTAVDIAASLSRSNTVDFTNLTPHGERLMREAPDVHAAHDTFFTERQVANNFIRDAREAVEGAQAANGGVVPPTPPEFMGTHRRDYADSLKDNPSARIIK